MILQLRLDERLTHGQVCTTWINFLGATHVIVANDQAAGDSFQKGLLTMGIPAHVKCIVTTLDKAVGLLKDQRAAQLKILLVVKTPEDAWKLVEAVDEIREVNVANFGALEKTGIQGRKAISDVLVLDEEDTKFIKKIMAKVSKIYHQPMTGSRPKKLEL